MYLYLISLVSSFRTLNVKHSYFPQGLNMFKNSKVNIAPFNNWSKALYMNSKILCKNVIAIKNYKKYQ